jgi:hypothetical protein
MRNQIRLLLKFGTVDRISLLNKGTEESCPIFILHCLFSYPAQRLRNLSWIREGRLNGKGGETE